MRVIPWMVVLVAVLSETLIGCASTTGTSSSAMDARIARVWRGRVAAERADEYERYLDEAGLRKFPTIPGNMGVQMFRRDLGDGTVEFVVTSYWPSLNAIHAYAGSDISKTRRLPRDAEFLIDPDPLVRHYEIRAWRGISLNAAPTQ